jgi:hypothetical protein
MGTRKLLLEDHDANEDHGCRIHYHLPYADDTDIPPLNEGVAEQRDLQHVEHHGYSNQGTEERRAEALRLPLPA